MKSGRVALRRGWRSDWFGENFDTLRGFFTLSP